MNNVDLVIGEFVRWVAQLPAEVTAALADGRVWLAILAAGLVVGAAVGVGRWIVTVFRLLPEPASNLERTAFALSIGLISMVAVWATVRSSGQSSFTPVGITIAGLTVLQSATWLRRRNLPLEPKDTPAPGSPADRPGRWAAGIVLGVVLVGLTYGTTIALSPREGVQPVEKMDEAYYAVLAADLAETGTENVYSSAGLPLPDGVSRQGWYHWGELWLASLPIALLGVTPLFALYYVAQPIVIISAALLAAMLVRRLTGTSSPRALWLSALAMVFLAPVSGTGFFGSWARGMISAVTHYGSAFVIVLLLLCIAAGVRPWLAGRNQTLLAGAVAASLIPAHIVVAIVATGGLIGALALRAIGEVLRGRWQRPRRASLGQAGILVVMSVVTLVYGLATGHGLVGAAPSSAPPFSLGWREGVLLTSIGAGIMLSIVVAWVYAARSRPFTADFLLVAILATLGGAVLWGLRVGDFNMYHGFYAPLAVLATPLAIVGVWLIVGWARSIGFARLGSTVVALLLLQTGVGVVSGVERLRALGPGAYDPVPLAVLAAIRLLPEDAKLAYRCNPLEEFAYHVPMLGSITAHTGRRVMPLCFQADWLPRLHGESVSELVPSPFFRLAPQRHLYPDASAMPSDETVEAFMRSVRVEYMLVDRTHPIAPVSGGLPIISVGDTEVLKLP